MEPPMKKPKIELEEQTPRKILRADKAPTDGYSLVVDGHFKSHHATVEAAEEAGLALKNQFQMLQVQVYDAATKTRSMIHWPAAVSRSWRFRAKHALGFDPRVESGSRQKTL
jgi:hypothetical protein